MVQNVDVENLMSKPEDAVIVAVEVTHQGKVYRSQIVDHSYQNISNLAAIVSRAVKNKLVRLHDGRIFSFDEFYDKYYVDVREIKN